MQFPCLPFPSAACPWSCLQHLLCQSSHQGELPSLHKLLPCWWFIFSADLKLSGKDGKVGWTFQQGMALQKVLWEAVCRTGAGFFLGAPNLAGVAPIHSSPTREPCWQEKERTESDQMGFWHELIFFARAERQEREERAHCSTLCLQKQTWNIPTRSRCKTPLSICLESWIAAVPDDFIPKNSATKTPKNFCHKSCGQEMAGRRRRRGFTSWK